MALQEKLRELFFLDQQIRGIQKQLNTATDRLKAQQAKLGQLNQQQHELDTQLKHAQAKAATLEHQVRDVDLRIADLRQRMLNVKSNKEYSAVLIEVNTLKEDKDQLETQTLEQLDHIETIKAQSQAIQQQAQEQEKLVAAAQGEVEQRQAKIGQELEQLQTQRSQAQQELDPETAALFNRMADLHDGHAMAPIAEENRRAKEYTCGGCYMSLPVERVSVVMSQPDQVVFCPSCNRILYLDHELKMSMSNK